MDNQKIAQELVAVAKDLTAARGFADSFNKADHNLRAFFIDVNRSRELPKKIQDKGLDHIRDAMQSLDKALKVLGDFM